MSLEESLGLLDEFCIPLGPFELHAPIGAGAMGDRLARSSRGPAGSGRGQSDHGSAGQASQVSCRIPQRSASRCPSRSSWDRSATYHLSGFIDATEG